MKPANDALRQSHAAVGLKCRHRAWRLFHEGPEAPSPDRELHRERRRRALAHALEEVAPNAERSVRATARGISIVADAVEPDGGLIGVRSSAAVKRHHIEALALQWLVLHGAKRPVSSGRIVHINPQHTPENATPLFSVVDVTAAVIRRAEDIDADLRELETALAGERPEPTVGKHCQRPFPCPFYTSCHPSVEAHPLSELYRVKRRVLGSLVQAGVSSIGDIPQDTPLPKTAALQREAVIQGKLVVSEELNEHLDRIQTPAAFIDFEAVQPTVPAWAGCKPFEMVPVQVSVHLLDPKGNLTHCEWIAEDRADPRPALAAWLAPKVRDAATLVAYNASFEQTILRKLSAVAPSGLKGDLLKATERFVDLYPIVRNHVYHPRFHGKFGLKTVLGVLLPHLSYQDLAVNRGDMASMVLEEFIIHQAPNAPDARAALKRDLLNYCQRDTLALVKIVEFLRNLKRA